MSFFSDIRDAYKAYKLYKSLDDSLREVMLPLPKGKTALGKLVDVVSKVLKEHKGE